MKINENTLLEGQRVLLVPYNAEHVPRYHEWMRSPELQQLTASEPLTLEQEYDMQRSWREDDDSTESSVFAPKITHDNQTETTFHNTVDFPECTFIILDTQKWADPSVNEETCMVGDVNIFLTDSTDPSLAELEIMIAGDSCLLRKPFLAFFTSCAQSQIICHTTEESYRGKGIGKEVTLMMMRYGVNKLGIKRFQAKIGLDNHTSIAMFKKLHFQEVSVCQVFKEVTLELTVDESVQKTLLEEVQMKERDYRQTCSGRRAQKGQNDTQVS